MRFRQRSPSRRRLFSLKIAAPLVGLAIIGAMLLWPALRGAGRTGGPMPHEVYVWQRHWSGAVVDALSDHGGTFSAIVPLVAEVSWTQNGPETVRIPVDYDRLAQTGRAVGLCIRIGAYSGSFDRDAPATRHIVALAQSVIAEASAAGIEPAELQIDFDSPASKLDGYRQWVDAVRSNIEPVPVTITALPNWLNRGRSFGRLVSAADAFVLQVHSLDRPAGFDDPMTLCDEAAALRAVERASRFGRPFVVALPTYSYLVAFDREGAFLGLAAEQRPPNWPADARLRLVRSDETTMASLVEAWTADRPGNMRGIIWYRLPTSDDRMNWRWETLAAIVDGRRPAPDLRASIQRTKPMLLEIDLVNHGEADAVLNVEVIVQTSTAPLASDALDGFERIPSDDRVRFRALPRQAVAVLGPAETRRAGWIRLLDDTDTEVEVHVQAISD